MPPRARGKRHNLSVRLPYDEYIEVVRRARRRGWSVSDFIGWCVVRELRNEHASALRASEAIAIVQGTPLQHSGADVWRTFTDDVTAAHHLHRSVVTEDQVPYPSEA